MFVLVPTLTRWLGPAPGTLAVFALYWFGFCLPLGFVFQRPGQRRGLLSLKVGEQRWVPWSVLALVSLLAVAAWFEWPRPTPWAAITWALPLAVVNGFAEEFYWRGAFVTQAGGRRGLQVWGVVLFTAWHIPLVFAHGVSYHGPIVVVGGAAVVGAFWGLIAARTGRIGWTVVSHILTNAIVFVDLIATNFGN
ncbi:CAAX amino terminal protease self- immunity [Roseimaritima ulvae]|uniref:CAAX amino terminal protease self-immunity n=2 Tax=Roseimaritima ulvae TaxID=980254 RepID=A0A5B9QZX9_9BACT|nr:CAAX amino terminal protease self- immunity [Roseimaritima ulvae]